MKYIVVYSSANNILFQIIANPAVNAAFLLQCILLSCSGNNKVYIKNSRDVNKKFQFWGYYFKTYQENIINISLSDQNKTQTSFIKLILLEMSFKCMLCNKNANIKQFSPFLNCCGAGAAGKVHTASRWQCNSIFLVQRMAESRVIETLFMESQD